MPETATAPDTTTTNSTPATSGGAFSFGDFFDAPAPTPAAAPAQAAPVEAAKTEEPAAPVATETPAAPEADDAFEEALRGTVEPPAAPVWDDTAKAAFKSTFGVEDPVAFKETFAKAEAELGTLREREAQQKGVIDLLNAIEERYPALANALLEANEGRDPFEYLNQLGDPKLIGKKAEELSESQLVDTYLQKHFSKAERDAIRTGDTSELDVSAEDLKAKVKHGISTAHDMHTQKNEAQTKANTEKATRMAESRKNFEASITNAIAKASADPLVRGAITPEVLTALRNNTLFNGSIFKDDGSYADTALSNYLKGTRYDSDIKRAYEHGKKAGSQGRAQEVVASLPTKPGASRQAPQTPAAAGKPTNNNTFVGLSEFMS